MVGISRRFAPWLLVFFPGVSVTAAGISPADQDAKGLADHIAKSGLEKKDRAGRIKNNDSYSYPRTAPIAFTEKFAEFLHQDIEQDDPSPVYSDVGAKGVTQKRELGWGRMMGMGMGMKGEHEGGAKKQMGGMKSMGPKKATVKSPTAAPVVSNKPLVVKSAYSIAYAAPEATREPTQDEYDEMTRLTNEYFAQKLIDYYGNDFKGVETSITNTLYEAALPEERFNIFMEFSSDVTFAKGLSPSPDAAEISAIIRDSINADYILGVVRSFSSPFESTNEIYFNFDAIAPGTSPPSPVPSPVSSPSTMKPALPTSIPVATNSPVPGVVIGVDYYIAYVVPDLTREPSVDEYEGLRSATNEYFVQLFTDYYQTNSEIAFLGFDSTIVTALYGDQAGKPDVRFNVDIEYSAEVTLAGSSLPDAAEIFDLMKSFINQQYLLDFVRLLTPFESTNEVVILQNL